MLVHSTFTTLKKSAGLFQPKLGSKPNVGLKMQLKTVDSES